MLRNAFIALAAACGLFAGTEMSGNKAQADSKFYFGIYGNGGGISLGTGGYGPGWHRHYPPAVYYPPPPVVYAPPPVVVAPLPATYSVYFRYYPGEPWRHYASFASHFRAHQAMDELRLRGIEAIEFRR